MLYAQYWPKKKSEGNIYPRAFQLLSLNYPVRSVCACTSGFFFRIQKDKDKRFTLGMLRKHYITVSKKQNPTQKTLC